MRRSTLHRSTLHRSALHRAAAHRTALRLIAGAVAATGLTAMLAGPAFAHVTVNAPGATRGGYTKLTFRVPTELDQPTTKVEVAFPTDTPLATVSVKPHPGWTYQVTTTKPEEPLTDDDGNTVEEVVSSITWTATGGGIAPGEFDEFELSVGPLPEVDNLTFKALQTYRDGTVVRWIEPDTEGSEPEHPAPVLALAAASSEPGDDGTEASPAAGASGSADEAVADGTEAGPAAEGEDGAGGSTTLSWVALVLAAVALAVSGVGLAVGRRARP